MEDPTSESTELGTTSMPLEDLLYGAEGSITYIPFFFGLWTATDDKGKRPKVGSKKWRAIATSTADDLDAFLMTVEPRPLY
jgi:hypothetical protein